MYAGLPDDAIIEEESPTGFVGLPADAVGTPVLPGPAPAKSSLLRRAVGDTGVSLLKGAIALPEAAVGIADIFSGGYVGKGAEALGFKPKEAKATLDTLYSPEQQVANEAVQSAEGFIPTVRSVLNNPSVIAQTALESAPSMIGAGGIARGLLTAAPQLATKTGARLIAGAAGEGIISAGSSAEQIRQSTPDGLLTPKQAVIPAVSGAATSMFGVVGGKVAKKLGIADVDTWLAGGAAPEAKKNILRRIFEGVVAEGALEELPQSAQEQAAQNLALGKPWDEGVANAAALGMFTGGVMGGGGNLISGFGATPTPPPTPTPEDLHSGVLESLSEKIANPDADLEELVKGKLASFYTPAGPTVRALLDNLAPADLQGQFSPLVQAGPTVRSILGGLKPDDYTLENNRPYGFNPETPFAEERDIRLQFWEEEQAQKAAEAQARFDSQNPVIPEAPEEAALRNTDYAGILSAMESNQFYSRHGKKGNVSTASDFTNMLKTNYPSLVGIDKDYILAALKAKLRTKGRKITEKQQAVIDLLNHDLANQENLFSAQTQAEQLRPEIEAANAATELAAERQAQLEVDRGLSLAEGELAGTPFEGAEAAPAPAKFLSKKGTINEPDLRVPETAGDRPFSSLPVAQRLQILEQEYQAVNVEKNVPAGTFRLSKKTDLAARLDAVASVFGHRVTLLAASKHLSFDGFVTPADNKNIYLTDDTESPLILLVGHEIAHQMEETAPELHKALGQELVKLADTSGVDIYFTTIFKSELNGNQASLTASQEWVADVVGTQFNRKEFWDALGKGDLTIARRVAEFVHSLIKRITASMGRANLAAATIKDITAAEKVVAKYMAKYAELQTSDPKYALVQTKTEAFKKWFGDSKVVDAQGEPLVVWHGTDQEFTVFDKSKIADGEEGGFFFTNSRAAAEDYGGRDVAAFLQLTNPVIMSYKAWQLGKGLTPQAARAAGHDGFIINNFDGIKGDRAYIVFEPTQIKDAYDNNGNFDPSNPDIRYATGPAPAPLTLAKVKAAFPGQSVTTDKDGSFVVTTPQGIIRVAPVGEIYFDRAAAEAAYGRKLSTTEVPVASFEQFPLEGLISLTEAGTGQLGHETFHAAAAMALTPGQLRALGKQFPTEEAAAAEYQRLLDAGAFDTGNSLLRKIYQFFQNLMELVRPTAAGVMRDIASGKVWNQRNARPAGARFALASDAGGSEGQRAAAQLAWAKLGTRSPFFQKWFGESKATWSGEAGGTPKVYYHGTRKDFNVFNTTDHMGRKKGVFFTENPEFADEYTSRFPEGAEGGNIMPVYLKAENPFDFRDPAHIKAVEKQLGEPVGFSVEQGDWDAIESERIQEVIQALGFDGFYVVERAQAGALEEVNLAVYDAGQVKSAWNSGEFGEGADIRYAAAWHGSPHDFDKFKTSQIGTGEGAQAYGYGLYFAGAKEVAEWYRDNLSRINNEDLAIHLANSNPDAVRIIKSALTMDGFGDNPRMALVGSIMQEFLNGSRPSNNTILLLGNNFAAVRDAILKVGNDKNIKGRLYHVELTPAEDEYLLWDKPLSEQSEKVKESLLEAVKGSTIEKEALARQDKASGAWIYNQLAIDRDSGKDTSEYLHSLGIRGIKYLDGDSRNRPLKDIKKAFLNELPQDSSFDDVMELVGTGKFTSDQERLLTALDADDWLGFDYPAQAISAALGDNLKGFDPSQELNDAVANLAKDQQFNYVIFSEDDVSVTAKYSLSSAINGYAKQVQDPAKLLERLNSGAKLDTFLAHFMPVNRMLDAFRDRKQLAPVKELINQLAENWQKQRIMQDDLLSYAGMRHNKALDAVAKEKGFGTDPEKRNQLNDLMAKSTLWQLYPGADKSIVWDDSSWAHAGMLEKTKLSLTAAQAKINADWRKMTSAMREAYTELLESNQRAFAQQKKENIQFIKRNITDPTKQAKLLQQVEARFNQVKGPYFPLMRFGSYVVNIKGVDTYDAEGNLERRGKTYYSAAFESQVDAEEFVKQARANPKAILAKDMDVSKLPELEVDPHHRPPVSRQQANIPDSFLSKLKGVLDVNGMVELRKELRAIRREVTKGVKDGSMAVPDSVQEKLAELSKAQTMAEAGRLQQELKDLVAATADEQNLLADVKGVFDGADLDEAVREQLKADFDQLWLAALPESSVMKHFVKRKGALGYEEDMLRSYLTYHQKHARAMAFIKYGSKIKANLADIKAKANELTDANDRFTVEQFAELMTNHQTHMMTEKVSPVVTQMTKWPFLWYLTSPSVLLVQSTQPYTITVPFLAARFSFSKAVAAVTRSYSRQLRKEFVDEKLLEFNEKHQELIDQLRDLDDNGNTEEMNRLTAKLTAQEKEMLAMAMTPTLSISLSHEAMEFIRSGSEARSKWLDKAGFFMSVSETASRKAGFLAAFDLKYQETGNFAAALKLATEAVNNTLYDYSAANRPKIMTGNIGRLMFQFRIYQVQTAFHILKLATDSSWLSTLPKAEKKRAQRELLTLMGMNFALAGSAGLPGVASVVFLMNVLHALLGDDDEPYDAAMELQQALLGLPGGEVLAKGLPALVGMDISRRIGAGGITNIFQSEPPEGKHGADLAGWYAANMAGASYSTYVTTPLQAAEAYRRGDWLDAFRAAMPKPVKDLAHAYQLSTEGQKTGSGLVLTPAEELNAWQIGLVALGVNPLEMSLASEEQRLETTYSTQIAERRQLLTKHFVQAVESGTQDEVQAAVEAIAEFDQKMPMFALKASDLMEAYRSGLKKELGLVDKQQMKVQMMYGRGAE